MVDVLKHAINHALARLSPVHLAGGGTQEISTATQESLRHIK